MNSPKYFRLTFSDLKTAKIMNGRIIRIQISGVNNDISFNFLSKLSYVATL